jgi:hypothetical protein
MIDNATDNAAPKKKWRWFIDLVSIPVGLNWQLHIGQLIEASAGEIMASQIESPVLSELRPFHGKPMVGSIAKQLCHQEQA